MRTEVKRGLLSHENRNVYQKHLVFSVNRPRAVFEPGVIHAPLQRRNPLVR
jgi:hypothetical protein